MAKKVTKPNHAFVHLSTDVKSGRLTFTRRDCGNEAIALTLAPDGLSNQPDVHAILRYEDGNHADDEEGLFLTYADVQWLSRAIPELLNEMERRGLDK